MNVNILYISDAVTSISLLLLALLSLFKQGYKNPVNRLFAEFSALTALWLVIGDISDSMRFPYNIVLIVYYIMFLSAFGSMIVLMKFVAKLTKVHKIEVLVRQTTLPLLMICLTGASPLVVSDVVIQGNMSGAEYGPLIWLFVAGLLYIVAVIIYAFISGLRHAKGLQKRQLMFAGVGVLVSLPAVIMLSLILPILTGMFWFSYFGTAPILILVFCLYYSVIRYHLFDIRSAAVRTLAYVLSLIFLVVTYYVLATIISNIFLDSNIIINQSPLSVALVFVMLFIFQPVKNFFDRLTNKIFYRSYYNSDEFFARLNRMQTSTTDLRTLLEKTANEIATTLKSEQAFFFIYTRDGHHSTAGTSHHQLLHKEDASLIKESYGKRNGVIVTALLDDNDPIRRLMIKNKIEIILPLIQNNVVGYLFIGEHKTSHFTARDIKVLSTIADGLVVAIQNTLSIHEIKDINASNLQRHINDATKDLRAKNELLRQLDEEKDEFVSVASHELRTPMTVIRGFIGMLKTEQLGKLNEQQQDILEKMSLNTKTLIDLVNEMLDLSKLESNKLDIKLSNNSLDDLIDQSINKISLLYDGKGVSLKHSGVDGQIKTDPVKFDRVLTNLLSNAYKFTPSSGTVTVSSTIDKAKHLATICVADTGVGVPPESLDLLFKKFSQVDNYLQRQAGGSGLGLAICRQLVEKLGGKIWVESQPGSGSQFYFTMPMVDSDI